MAVTIPVVAHLAATSRAPEDVEALLKATWRYLPSNLEVELVGVRDDPVPIGALHDAFPNDPRIRSSRRRPNGLGLANLPAFDHQAMNLFFTSEILAIGGQVSGAPHHALVPHKLQQLALVPDELDGNEVELIARCLLDLAGLTPQETAPEARPEPPPREEPRAALLDDSRLLAGLMRAEFRPGPKLSESHGPDDPALPERPLMAVVEPETAGPMVSDLDALPPELRPRDLEPPLLAWHPRSPASAASPPAPPATELRLPVYGVELDGGQGLAALLTRANELWKAAGIGFELVGYGAGPGSLERACPREPESQAPLADCGPLRRSAGYHSRGINLYRATFLPLRGTVRTLPMVAYPAERILLLAHDASERWLALGLGLILGLAPSQGAPQRLTNFPEPGTQLSPDDVRWARQRAARLLGPPEPVDRWTLRLPLRIHRVGHAEVGATRTRRELEEAVRSANAILAPAGIQAEIQSWSETRLSDALLSQVLPSGTSAPDGAPLTLLPEFDAMAHNLFYVKEIRNRATGSLQVGVAYLTPGVTLVSESVPSAGSCLALTLATQMGARFVDAPPERLLARNSFRGTRLTPDECASLRVQGLQRLMLHLPPAECALAPMRIPLRLHLVVHRQAGVDQPVAFFEACVAYANQFFAPAGLAFEVVGAAPTAVQDAVLARALPPPPEVPNGIPLTQLPEFEPGALNVFFVRSALGRPGVYYAHRRVLVVSQSLPAASGPQCLAAGLGLHLGLSYVRDDARRLMAGGTELTAAEIATVREWAVERDLVE